MARRLTTLTLIAVTVALGLAARGAHREAAAQSGTPPVTARLPHTEADVHFMSGMIHHHAQALVMAEWAPTHGASQGLQTLAQRIIISQTDEIALIQLWLQDHGERVPEANPKGATTDVGGMAHTTLMPGMLTEEQTAELDAARGAEFDRLFLTFMIQHHLGALKMVEDLFATNGGGQEETVFKLASDVFGDQSAEIERMENTLAAMSGAGPDR
jgi:uncharacterized protein (DUF305 family)